MDGCCGMKGFLTFLVLRMISKKPMCGDEIRDELEKRKGSRPSPGTVYPVLKNLSANGLIVETDKGGKEKQYTITPLGKKELERVTKHFIALFCDMKDEFRKS